MCGVHPGVWVFGVGVSNAKLGLVPKLRNRFGVLPQPSPKKPPAFKGLVPDERNRFGRLSAMPRTPNLLRSVGTSPTAAAACVCGVQPGVRVFDVVESNAKLGLVP